jgi:hypothetical protein
MPHIVAGQNIIENLLFYKEYATLTPNAPPASL